MISVALRLVLRQSFENYSDTAPTRIKVWLGSSGQCSSLDLPQVDLMSFRVA